MSSLRGEPVLDEIQRIPMSWGEYLVLADDGDQKVEWVDGEVLVMPPPGWNHGRIQLRLGAAIIASSTLDAATETDLQLPRNRVRRPDVMAMPPISHVEGSDDRVTRVPFLVAEVLSRSSRSEDTVRKWAEYADYGIAQYWLVDPIARVIDVYENVDGGWQPVVRVDPDRPTGDVAVGEHGTIHLVLDDIVGPAE